MIELNNTTDDALIDLLHDPIKYVSLASGITLRNYQTPAFLRVIDSVFNRYGDSIVIMFARQSGKNEIQVHLENYLLVLHSQLGGDIVKVSPTWKPQSLNAMRRLEKNLKSSSFTFRRHKKTNGYIFTYYNANIAFFSAAPESNIVGATASILLEVDEAQDVSIDKYDKDIAPMASSTHATRVFYGTAWTSFTLLARELRAARAAEAIDGRPRVFVVDANQVGAEVPAYKRHVAEIIRKQGRNHPMVKTQYYCEEVDAEAGMFHPARLALMLADQPAQSAPILGHIYAFCIDVGGADESEDRANPRRDSTSLSIVDVDLTSLEDLEAPTYRIVQRIAWIGESHKHTYAQIKSLAQAWNPLRLLIDATGVGEGLWSMLSSAFPGKVTPVKFSASKKSEIGYMFLSIIETGRLRDCCPSPESSLQYRYCQSQIQPGPTHPMRWGVPEGARDPQTGALIHDDIILADALISQLDDMEWILPGESRIIKRNLQKEIEGAY